VVPGCAAEPRVGVLALVPGALAVVDPLELPPLPAGAAEFEDDAPIGSLSASDAGPTLPPVAEAEPPAVEPLVLGCTFGSAVIAGASASAGADDMTTMAMIAAMTPRIVLFTA
jgi:hypothetical protein